MTRVIELNDVALRLADDNGVLATSPGYAVVDARRLVVGEAALRQARIDPRHTTNQFWHKLSMDPVPHPHPSARSLADLAHAHLLELWEAAAADDDEIIFTVPGTLERDQIALLLGIARECPFRAVGLVDAAVAATAARQPDAERVAHVDALLHETVLSVVDGGSSESWQRTAVVDVPQFGLAGLREAWINVIADTFVRETRFDPLHDARTEQSLFDRLDGWLDALATRSEIDLEVESAAQIHRVALSRARLVEKVMPRLEQLADALARALPDDGAVLVSSALGRLPGLLDVLAERLGRAPEVLDDDAVVRGALGHEAEVRHDGEALRFVTRLPRKIREASAPTAPERAAEAPAATADDAARAPQTTASAPASGEATSPGGSAQAVTHVLVGHRAWPLVGDRIAIGGEHGVDGARLPVTLGTLEHRADGWHLVAAGGGPELPALAPGEARVLGPAHTLVTLIRVEGG